MPLVVNINMDTRTNFDELKKEKDDLDKIVHVRKKKNSWIHIPIMSKKKTEIYFTIAYFVWREY